MQFRLILYRLYCTSVAISPNSQIARYGRIGQIENARRVFDQMRDRSIISWNSMIDGYFRNYRPLEAQLLFDRMPERNTVSWNMLVSGYIKNGMVSEARKVFNLMPKRDVVSWTAMVSGYVQEGKISEAELLFLLMPEKDVVVGTNMILGYCRQGRLAEAREIFDQMPCRNVITWTTMISGYAHNQRVDVARNLFEVMPEKNEVSWTAMLKGYTQCGLMEEAAELFDAMPVKTTIACNAMILCFGRNGEVVKARRVFEQTSEKDDGTWSAMIKVYERNGFVLDALGLFSLMQREEVRPDFRSLMSVLCVCASLASLDHGRQVHAHLVRFQFDFDVSVASALITMYVKCGNIVKAKRVFERFSPKSIVMWNSIITGYAEHGLGDEALQVFHEMCSLDIAPDDVSFIGVLSACSYTGKTKEGFEIFESMNAKYQVVPRIEHYACMVDLLGRAGQVNEAMNLIEKMPVEANAIVWGALLGACRTHMKLDLAEVAAKKLLQLEPKNAGAYISLSNIYASKGKWSDVADLKEKMRARSVKRPPGCSWI